MPFPVRHEPHGRNVVLEAPQECVKMCLRRHDLVADLADLADVDLLPSDDGPVKRVTTRERGPPSRWRAAR